MSERPKITFEKRKQGDFYSTAKVRVDAYFREQGLSSHANWKMILKTCAHFFIFFSLFFAIYTNQFTGLPLVFLFSLLGVTKALLGFNVTHDALHGSYSQYPLINHFLGYGFDLNGESSYVWKLSHNLQHHTYTNIQGADLDIEKSFFFRFSPHDPPLFFHRWQHIYAPLLYSLLTLQWVLFSDYIWFYKEMKDGKPTRTDIFAFFFFKIINFLLFLFLPLLLLTGPLWAILTGFLMMHLSAGFVISIIFQLAHLVEGVHFPKPNSKSHIPKEWALHEMETTSNFATENRWLSWWVGGLNFQVEHHLFPRVCHVHYPEVSKILKKTAQEFSIPYHEQATFFGAIGSHLRLLKQFGQSDKPFRS